MQTYFRTAVIFLFLFIIYSIGFQVSAQTSPDITSNLVGHWAFEEGSGTTTFDSSGNNYNGTLFGDTSWVSGKVGTWAVSFDGNGDYINITDPNLGSGVSAFTISLWFKANTSTLTANRGLLCVPSQGGTRSPFCTIIDRQSTGGRISFSVGTSTSLAAAKSDTTLNTTDWVHLVGVYDGSNLKMYLNNVLQTSQPVATGPTTNPSTLLRMNFSYVYGEVGTFAGLLDDVRVYHRALSAEDIGALYDLGSIPPPPPDTEDPTVSVTSPSTGSTVFGTVNVTANAADNIGVAGVQFLFDGAALSLEDTSAPYAISWDTTLVSNGSHTLAAVARDAVGNVATSTLVSVTVDNVPPPQDVTPPIVSITSPTGGATLQGSVTISANASDDVGVTSVRFAVDGVYAGLADTTSPYETLWNTSSIANGSYSLTAEARDAAGNVATSSPVSVSVNNPPPPAVDLVSDLKLHLRFEERLGTTTLDTSGNGFVATLHEGTSWVKGKFGSGVFFDGINDYVEIIDPNLASGVSTFTISEWFRANEITGTKNRGLFCIPSQAATKSPFCTNLERTSSGGTIVFYVGTTTSSVIAKSNVALNTTDWVHVTGVFDGSNLKLYVNGVLQTSQPLASGITTNPPTNLRLNYSNSYGETGNFGGVMDDVRIYHRALNAEEVQALYTLADTEAPFEEEELAVWIEEPAYGSVVSGTTTQITAQIDDGLPIARAQFYLDGTPLGALDAVVPYSVNWNTSLVPNGNHSLIVVATSPSGVVATSSPVIIEVRNLPDTTPPSSPGQLKLIPVGANQINVVWTRSVDDVLILNYDIYKCLGVACTPDSLIGTTASGIFRDTNLATSTAYSYHIVARDAAGNLSAPSGTVTGSTLSSTALCNESDNRFSFGVFSDSYSGQESGVRRLIAETLAFDPNMRMFFTGGDTPSYERVRGIVNEFNGQGLCTGSQFAFFPAPGNHDAEVQAYMDWWATNWTGDWENSPETSPLALHLPEVANFKRGPLAVRNATGTTTPIQDGTIYSFDYKNAHFVIVNAYEQGIGDEFAGVWDYNGPGVFDPTDSQLDWIAADLASSTKPLKFAFAHNALVTPVYSLSATTTPPGWSEHNASFHMNEVAEVFAANGLTAYYFGHDHVSSRILTDGSRARLYERLYWDIEDDPLKPLANPTEWESLEGPGTIWELDAGRVYSTSGFYIITRVGDQEVTFEIYRMPNSTPGTSYLWDTWSIPVGE